MSYEAGSKECRHLIEAKDSLLSAMESLSNISSTDVLQIQIKDIYNKPTIIITTDGKNGKGSARSIVGFDIGSVILAAVQKKILIINYKKPLKI